MSITRKGPVIILSFIYVDGSNSGHVRVYQYNGSSSILVGQDIDGKRDSSSGSLVSLSPDGTL